MNRKEKTVIAGMAGNFILAIAKTILSIISGSAALIADALHSVSDLLVSLLVLAGIKLNRKKIEALVTLIVGLMIISVAVGFVSELFFSKPRIIENLVWTVPGLILIIIFTYILYRYKTVIGTEEQSESLIADGAHTKSDLLSSFGVLLSLIGSLVGLNIDKAAAFIIFFLIFYQGIETILRALYLYKGRDDFHFDLKKISTDLYHIARKGRKKLIPVLLAFFMLIYILPGFYIVRQNQSSVRTILGVIEEDIKGPGLHFDPFHFISTNEKINTSDMRRLEYGFSINEREGNDILINQMETVHHSRKYSVKADEENIITGDGSVINFYLIVEYRIPDPYSYLACTETPIEILRVETGSQIQKAAGSLPLFDVLNGKRAYLENRIRKELNLSMNKLETGIYVEDIIIYSITPHLDTVYMFRKVQDEEQFKETLLYDAEAVKARQIPYYRGLAYEKILNAQAASNEIILKAEREAAYYKKMEKEFQMNREAVVYRLGLDSRVRLFKDARKILIDDSLESEQLRLNYKSGTQ